MNYSNYIFINTDIRFGKPCIKGTRITVFEVLGWLAFGMNLTNIITDYPELKQYDIQACLAFTDDKEHKLNIAS